MNAHTYIYVRVVFSKKQTAFFVDGMAILIIVRVIDRSDIHIHKCM